MIDQLKEFLKIELFSYKQFELTLFNLVIVVGIYALTILGLRVVKFFIDRSIRQKQWVNRSSLYALQKLIAYFAYTLATLMALESVGLDLTLLMAGSAALLVGIGLGIQQIFNDFICGIILLFGGTVRVGDIVEFNNTVGRVIEIDFRASRIRTRDNVTLIVPNSKLISDNVINWSEGELFRRFHIEVGVAYGSDTALVRQVLTEAAQSHEAVSDKHPVQVQFSNFGDSSLDFVLLFWTEKAWEIEFVKSELRFEIDKRFRQDGITIPFPQRDVHMKNS